MLFSAVAILYPASIGPRPIQGIEPQVGARLAIDRFLPRNSTHQRCGEIMQEHEA